MTTVNANVTPGKVFVKDANGRVLIDIEDLTALGTPTVTVDLSGQVASGDIAASAVTAAKLADAVADALPAATATVGDEDSNNVDVTVQFQDAQGNNLADRCVFFYWLSDAANGAPTSTMPDGGVSVTTGTEIIAAAADALAAAATDANGQAVIRATESGALTRYFNLIVLNQLVAGSQALVWTT